MILPFDDQAVDEKHRVQQEIMKEAGGDLKKYSEIVKAEAKKLREQKPGYFKVKEKNPPIST